VGTLTDFPALFSQTYTALFGAGVPPPQNSLSIYDASGNLLPFGVRRYDGTTCFMDWQGDFAGVAKTVYLYWHPTVDPGSSFANPTGVYDASTNAVWHMEDAGPTNVLDATSNGKNGTQSGGVTFGATGQIAKCCSWDGLNDAVSMGDVLDLTGIDDPRTWSCWVKCTNAAANQRAIISKEDFHSPWYGFILEYYEATKIRWQLYQGGDFNRLGKIWNVTHNPTAWTHIAVTKGDRTAAQLKLYVNGTEIVSVSTTYDTLSSLLDNPCPYQLASRDGANHLLAGSLDAVWDSAVSRSATWINAEYLFGLGTAITVGAPEAYAAGGGRLFRQQNRRSVIAPGVIRC
jgi:hypothetical protein